MRGHAPPAFFLKGAIALVVLFLVTLAMEPAPAVDALRALIGVGLAIVIGKLILRHYGKRS